MFRMNGNTFEIVILGRSDMILVAQVCVLVC